MVIQYDEKGRIFSCNADKFEAKLKPGKLIIKVPDHGLPEDFQATFALGKYLVRKGIIIENKKFVPPEVT